MVGSNSLMFYTLTHIPASVQRRGQAMLANQILNLVNETVYRSSYTDLYAEGDRERESHSSASREHKHEDVRTYTSLC